MPTTPGTIGTPAGATAEALRLSTWQYNPPSTGGVAVGAAGWTLNVLVKAWLGPWAVLLLPSQSNTPSLTAVRKRTLRVSADPAAPAVPRIACPASQLPFCRSELAGVQITE